MLGKGSGKIAVTLIVISVLILFLSFYYQFVVIPPKEESLKSLENDRDLTKAELSIIERQVEENESILGEWKQGNSFELHDPFNKEVISFLENDTSSTAVEIINNSKNQGIRCAFVEVVQGNALYINRLIGFDTLEDGMRYFEPETKYEVVPEIGRRYIKCVVGEPYETSLIFHLISDVLIVW